VRKKMKKSNVWTQGEVTFLRRHYRKQPSAWVAKQLGRTVYAVRYKASDLGIKKSWPLVWKSKKSKAARKGVKFVRKYA
jgi:hypothetical protein